MAEVLTLQQAKCETCMSEVQMVLKKHGCVIVPDVRIFGGQLISGFAVVPAQPSVVSN